MLSCNFSDRSQLRPHFKIDAIHGFLGRGTDWDLVFGDDFLKEQGWELNKYDLSSEHWVRDFWDASDRASERKFDPDVHSQSPILMGYSLGGRIALQALLKEPQRWKAAVIISAHPGLPDAIHNNDKNNDKQQRLLSDQHWAKCILEDPWEDWVKRWNQQPVFQGGGEPLLRKETDYSRAQLARLLLDFSLGKQRDLRPELSHLNLPILWISGEHDARYQSIVHEMNLLNPHAQMVIIPGAGHRVPWDRPIEFRDKLISFLKTVS